MASRTISQIWDSEAIAGAISSEFEYITSSVMEENEPNRVERFVKNYCHNLMTSVVSFPDAVSDDYIYSMIEQAITHNVVQLVIEYRNIKHITEVEGGKNHTTNSASPYRKERIANETLNWNDYDIIIKQKQIAGEVRCLRDIYVEIQLLTREYSV
jgi:hypothetical protein